MTAHDHDDDDHHRHTPIAWMVAAKAPFRARMIAALAAGPVHLDMLGADPTGQLGLAIDDLIATGAATIAGRTLIAGDPQ